MSECPNLRVCEPHKPGNDGVQHVLIIEDAVLTLLHNAINELHKVGLK